jgi:cytidine deaminase
MTNEALLEHAAAARQAAYAPYSKFQVGAALLSASGEVFTACNVENASYGLTICAERAAVFNAVAAGQRDFTALAICLPEAGSPCGACRQVLHEFAPNLPILLGDETGQLVRLTSLAELLPDAFGPENLHLTPKSG